MEKRSAIVVQSPTESRAALRRIPSVIEDIKLPPSGARLYQDTLVSPLRLRASRRGLTWVFTGRTPKGPRREQPLGRWPFMNIDQARIAAQKVAATPATTSTVSSVTTFAQTRAAYFDSAEFKQLGQRTQSSYKWVLGPREAKEPDKPAPKASDFEDLAARKIRDITRLDLLAIKDRVAASGRAFQNILRPAQALFTWALDRGYIDMSPAMRLRLPLNEADPHPYSDKELGAMVTAAREAEEPWRTLYLLVAYTGQRPITWTHAKWTEVSLRTATLTVSRTRGRKSKLKRGWSIPLAPPAVKLLEALFKRQGRQRNEWLFGQPIAAESKIRNKIARAAGMPGEKQKAGNGEWQKARRGNRGNMHRFRATMLTKFDEWGVVTETAQRLAGHASPFSGSRGHYVVASPSPDMRKIAIRYAEHVDYCELL